MSTKQEHDDNLLPIPPNSLTELVIKAPLSKPVGFQFDVKQWLGDHMIMSMSYAEQGMHIRLLCIAWQETPPCTLPNDDLVIANWLNLSPQEWSNIHKSKVMQAWKVVPTEEIGAGRWISEGLQRSYLRQVSILSTRSMAAQIRWNRERDAKLKELLPSNELTTEAIIPAKNETKEDQTALIWRMGVELLSPSHGNTQSRQLIGKWIKNYGEDVVASCLTDLSLKAHTVADRFTYISSILKSKNKLTTQRTTRNSSLVL